ncbi:PREDICTED: protein BEX4 [Miniopterus natalensis]|uniref:protein BEX4 n=1 Tax=Miniopterus natalensis TaxID=291302 RepID=UPI0007A70CD3|nr:PREDICTED: protein BEX4 [Miniopterus natalensis]XP_016051213.1 PREDICTED: protein BEX4 [Miniopterus natalensis]XP_016051214.1 PREDICTED: protein BEX4 [Miniopterus natalensis]
MASKEEPTLKILNMENAQQENEGGDQALVQNEEKPHNLGGGEAQKPVGNVRLGWVKRLVPNFRRGISNKRVDHSEVGDNIEKIAMQRMEIRRKTREQQMRHVMRFQTPEPDNHYDFCLIP